MRNRLLAAAVCASLAGLAMGVEPGDGVIREGEGARRADLNARELRPFDAGAWTSLTDWKNGAALSAASTAGKPVLILTWTDYIPASKRAFALAQKLAEAKHAQGLIVVCVHGKDEWTAANKPAPAAGNLLLAHDATGAFRGAIRSDNDPDFYVLDRAGQLRYADIATESVEAAVERVCAESLDDAKGLNDRIAADVRQKDADLKRAEALRAGVDLTSLPEQPFELPGESAYQLASWPELPKDPQNGFQATSPGEKQEPQKASIPDVGWLPDKPELKGRVVLMYFWHPDIPASYRDIATFDLIQTQRGRDVVVVGVLTPPNDPNQGYGQPTIELDPEKLQVKIKEFQRARPQRHPVLVDLQAGLFTTSKTYYQSFQQGVPAPWVAIVSSDGMMRWWGPMRASGYEAAMDRVLTVDPGVKARRAAEQAYIRSHQGK